MAQKPLFPLNLMLPPEDAFYAALSAINDRGLTITKSDVAYKDLAPDATREDANTIVTLSVVPNSRIVMGDDRQQWYTRYSLTEVLGFQGFQGNTVAVGEQDPADWADAKVAALAVLNAAAKAAITPDRVQWVQSSRNETGLTGSLVMVDGDLVLLGSAVIEVTFTEGANV